MSPRRKILNVGEARGKECVFIAIRKHFQETTLNSAINGCSGMVQRYTLPLI